MSMEALKRVTETLVIDPPADDVAAFATMSAFIADCRRRHTTTRESCDSTQWKWQLVPELPYDKTERAN
jgi:hypothetical protein